MLERFFFCSLLLDSLYLLVSFFLSHTHKGFRLLNAIEQHAFDKYLLCEIRIDALPFARSLAHVQHSLQSRKYVHASALWQCAIMQSTCPAIARLFAPSCTHTHTQTMARADLVPPMYVHTLVLGNGKSLCLGVRMHLLRVEFCSIKRVSSLVFFSSLSLHFI